MTFLDFASDYFTSQLVLLTLVLLCAALGLIFALFKLERYRPERRLQILFACFGLVISAWGFLGLSLLFCYAFIGLYKGGDELVAIRMVFGLSLLASVLVALPVSAFVTFKVPAAVSRRLLGELQEPDRAIVEVSRRISEDFRISIAPRILESPSPVPFAYSVGGRESIVVISRGIVARLDADELETVLGHELAHVKGHETGLSTAIAVYRRVLFFDPFIRLLEGAVCSEKEFSADEISARETGKPLSLASALLKISSAQSEGAGPSYSSSYSSRIGGFSILGGGKLPRSPSVKERIERLMRLANELEEREDSRLHHPPLAPPKR